MNTQREDPMSKLEGRLATLVLSLCGLAFLAFATGCASYATGKAMTAAGFQTPRHHPATVFVKVAEGPEGDVVLNVPQISSDALREALVATIEDCRVFAGTLPQAAADYCLEVSIVSAKPKGLLSNAIRMTARWKLTRSSDSKRVFDEFIESHGKPGGALGSARMRQSLERAGRENITLGLTKLSQLDFQ